MRWDFHGLTVEGICDDTPIGERWRATFASRPQASSTADLVFRLALAAEVPPAPSGPPDFQQAELLAYYLDGTQVTAHFPRYGQIRLDLSQGASRGVVTPAALATQGVFEDLIAIGLSPHFRRRGRFLLHAFAACSPPAPEPHADVAPFPLPDRQSQRHHTSGAPRAQESPWSRAGVLLVGDIGAGKTTTGLALLHAGWKLVSNDSPVLTRPPNVTSLDILAYPGLLSAHPDTLARFPELSSLAPASAARQKTLFAAESIYPQVWVDSAPPAAIFFPQVESRPDHALERLSGPEALRLILPHAIEQWDREMIPPHLALLNQLVQAVPAYCLRLGPDTSSLPEVIAAGLAGG